MCSAALGSPHEGCASARALLRRFSVPLAKLQPGRYTCQVNVLDPTAQKFAFWRAPVVVLAEAVDKRAGEMVGSKSDGR